MGHICENDFQTDMLTKIITTAIAVVCLAGGTSAYFDVCYYSDTTCTTKIQCMTMVEDNAAHKKQEAAGAAARAAEIAKLKAQGVDTSNMIVQSNDDDDNGVVRNSCEEAFDYANKMISAAEPPMTKSVFELCEASQTSTMEPSGGVVYKSMKHVCTGSSAVTTTVGVGIFAIVAALF